MALLLATVCYTCLFELRKCTFTRGSPMAAHKFRMYHERVIDLSQGKRKPIHHPYPWCRLLPLLKRLFPFFLSLSPSLLFSFFFFSSTATRDQRTRESNTRVKWSRWSFSFSLSTYGFPRYRHATHTHTSIWWLADTWLGIVIVSFSLSLSLSFCTTENQTTHARCVPCDLIRL